MLDAGASRSGSCVGLTIARGPTAGSEANGGTGSQYTVSLSFLACSYANETRASASAYTCFTAADTEARAVILAASPSSAAACVSRATWWPYW